MSISTNDAPAAAAPIAAPMVRPVTSSLARASSTTLAAPLTVEPDSICAVLLAVSTMTTTAAPSPTKPPPPATDSTCTSWSRLEATRSWLPANSVPPALAETLLLMMSTPIDAPTPTAPTPTAPIVTSNSTSSLA